MTRTTITPFVNSTAEAVELSSDGKKKTYWRKEILPSGTRQYKGQTLDFSKINPACLKAFEDGAFDAVPFVLALSDNSHPDTGQEHEQLEGDLHKLELSEGSLFGYFDFSASPEMQSKIEKSNRKFGVSGRIEVNYKREDTGKSYEYALSHVCGTTRAHVKGMKPWETVELSEAEKKSITVDLSTEVIDAETDTTDSGEITLPEQVKLEDFNAVMAFIKEQKDAEAAIAALGSKKEETATATLSEKDQNAITLSEQRANQAIQLAEAAATELAATKWESLKSNLVRDGVPPAIVNLAEGVLSSPKKAVIKLSDTEEIDATKVITDILDACKGTIKLSEESGTQYRNEAPTDDKEMEAWMEDWGYKAPSQS